MTKPRKPVEWGLDGEPASEGRGAGSVTPQSGVGSSSAKGSIATPVSTGCANQWLREAMGLAEGDTPFPWQEELLARFVEGEIARSLDIPTGLGKTAVMAIWLVARALGAVLPRRLVYVVDRRAVVDQATDVATGLRKYVDGTQEFKAALGLGARSLPISTLRGQHVDNKEWLEDPAAPAIIVGTVDMIGSRLLFEGYGTTRKMRPYYAGLLGADTLVVLDEAHLVPPFEKLLESIADGSSLFGARDDTLRRLVPPFRLLSLSATGRGVAGKSFGLRQADLKHPIVKRRLDAPKRLTIHPLEDKTRLEHALADHAWKLSDNGTRAVRCIVFCDKRKVAAAAKEAIEDRAKGDKKVETELFVGGRRVFEREAAAKRLKELGFIAGTKVERERPAFVFATSAGEVGVDLDADHMICDLVAWERMVQRLGRVNRRGDGKASVIVLVEPEPKPTRREQEAFEKKENGKELEEKERKSIEGFEVTVRTWRSLQELLERLRKNGDFADASPGALRALKLQAEADSELLKVLDAATTPAPLRPALSRALLDAWSMTSLEKHTGRPEIGPWLRGWIKEDPQTAVVWRMYLPVRTSGIAATAKEAGAFFEAAPPHASELLETETFRVVVWLEARAKALFSGPPATSEEDNSQEKARLRREDAVAFVLTPAGDLRRTLRLDDFAAGNDNKADKERRESLQDALAGATLVVDARLAGLRDGLLDEAEGAVPRTVDDGEEWLGENVVRFRVRSAEVSEAVASDSRWRERRRFATDLSEEGEPQRWLIVEKWRHDAATEEDRSAARPQRLDEHESWAEDRARDLATRLSLPDDYAGMLAIAARLHDEGKRGTRWQRAFNAPGDGVYAKTKGPIDYALLDGYRHELGSLPHAEKALRLRGLREDLCELALHLIAAHHGFARPVIGTRGCEDAPPSALEERAKELALRFARLQMRWGPWGLGWWEALLRAADQQASRDNDVGDAGSDRGGA